MMVLFTTFGLAIGVVLSWGALAVAGAGHGWIAPARICWTTLLIGPLAGVAWSYRRKRIGRILCFVLLVITFGTDLILLVDTWRDSQHPFSRLWESERQAIITWLILWAHYHFLIAVCFLGVEHSLSRSHDSDR
jgi:hypothetical protein